MRIKRIDINAFGKLKDLRMDTDSGFNVICGENGSGKSTVMDFIKSVFYGIGKPRERTRRLPWDGTKASGSITYSDNDTVSLCQVTFGKTAKGDKCEVLSDINGETLGTDYPGPEIFSMSDITFSKTAFISSVGSEIDKKGDDEIAEKLSNLRETGDESVSFSAATANVDGYMAKLVAKRGRGGRIQQLEDAIEEIKSKVVSAERSEEEKQRIKNDIESARMRRDAVAEEIAFLKTASEAKEFKYINDIKTQLDSLPESGNAGGARSYLEKIKQLTDELSAVDKRISEIPHEECVRRHITEDEFASVTEAYYSKSKKSNPAVFVLMLVLALAFLVLGIFNPWFFIGMPVFVIAAVMFIPKKQKGKSLEDVLSEFGEKDYEAFRLRYMDQERQDALRESSARERKRLEDERIRISELLNRERSAASEEYGSYRQLEDIIKAEEKTELDRMSLTSALNAALRGRSFQELSEKYRSFEGEIPDNCDERLKIAERQLSENSATIASLEYRGGVLEGSGEDSFELKSQIAELTDRKDSFLYDYDVLSTVLEVLNESYEVMEGEFGEKLNSLAGEILSDVTGYDTARMNRDFEIKLTENGEVHELSGFSTGLFQQACLSFRLAMLELMDTKSPVFLDDSLMTYDDEKAGKLMRYLKKLSEKRQIFLFTCRSRDAALAEQVGANIIKL